MNQSVSIAILYEFVDLNFDVQRSHSALYSIPFPQIFSPYLCRAL